jgi:hypothetical protein
MHGASNVFVVTIRHPLPPFTDLAEGIDLPPFKIVNHLPYMLMLGTQECDAVSNPIKESTRFTHALTMPIIMISREHKQDTHLTQCKLKSDARNEINILDVHVVILLRK